MPELFTSCKVEGTDGSESPDDIKVKVEKIFYLVQNIVGKREINGSVEYRVKWENYPSSQNTWEPAENLQCDNLVQAYERKKLLSQQRGRGRPRSVNNRITESQDWEFRTFTTHTYHTRRSRRQLRVNRLTRALLDAGELCGLDIGLKLQSILNGWLCPNGTLFFLVRYIDNTVELVRSDIVNEREPQKVISFYESRLVFSDVNKEYK